MSIAYNEINETIKMVQSENLDIRTVTMGINLLDCIKSDPKETSHAVYDKITFVAKDLVKVAEDLEEEYGIPIVNKRISVTPISLIGSRFNYDDFVYLADVLDKAAKDTGVNFLGGFSALVHKGFTNSDVYLIKSLPEVLAETERICASVNVATTKAGINMDAVGIMGKIIKETANKTSDKDGLGCTKLVVFANAPEDNPFMAGAYHGIGESETTVNIGISGPGVVYNAVKNLGYDKDFGELSEIVKKTAFKITRAGELIGRLAADRLQTHFGIIDLSLAPTPAIGDSIANIIEEMGIEMCGAPGTTAALALLNDAVKKGGVMATSYVGGLSGAFIPVSEDAGMINAAKKGALRIEKLEAMTCVCSVGLDMIAVPGDTSEYTISGIIADEMAIGMINRKTTAVRLIPAPGKKAGDFVEFGGLLGRAPVIEVNKYSPEIFVKRGGRIPAPIHSLNN